MLAKIQTHYEQNGDHLRIREQAVNGAYVCPVRGKLTKYAYRILGTFEDAEDAVHDTYERVLRYQNAFKEGYDFDAWVFIILINVVNSIKAGKTNEPVTIEADDSTTADEYLVPADTPEELVSLLKWESAFSRICLKLSVRDVSILELYFLYGHSMPVVSDLLGVNIHTVKRVINEHRKEVIGG